MKEPQICLENCDVIKVPWESVVNLSIYKVHKTYHFSKNMNLEMLVADDVLLTLSKSADLPHKKWGIKDCETTVFKRLLAYNDIVAVVLIHDDGRKECYYVDYQEDASSCCNELQSTEIGE